MPIYEYTCQKCGETIEAMQKITDKPLARHTRCGGRLEKQWSQTSFQLKGSGWYVTDYAGRRTNGKEAAPVEGAEKKTDGAAEKKSETAEASATDSKKEPAVSATASTSKKAKTEKE